MSVHSERRAPIRAKVREAVSEAILEAAEAVALETGLDGMTISAVAERAGVAVGTLYNYFPDREGIITALFKSRRADIVPRVEAAAEAAKDLPFAERVRAFVGEMLAVLDSEQRFLRLAVMADQQGSKLRPRDTTLMNVIITALEQIMRDGAHKKLFPATRAPIYARMLQGLIKGVFVWRLERDEALTEDVDVIVDTFLRGVGA